MKLFLRQPYEANAFYRATCCPQLTVNSAGFNASETLKLGKVNQMKKRFERGSLDSLFAIDSQLVELFCLLYRIIERCKKKMQD